MTDKPTIDPWVKTAVERQAAYMSHCRDNGYDAGVDELEAIITRHAAPVLAEKDRLIDFWRKAAGIEQDEAFEVDKEIAKLKDYSDRWPGNMMDEYQAMQEELAEARAEIERLQGLCSDYIEGRA